MHLTSEQKECRQETREGHGDGVGECQLDHFAVREPDERGQRGGEEEEERLLDIMDDWELCRQHQQPKEIEP